jgi:hypothetical protein
MAGRLINNEPESMWKETVMSYCEVLILPFGWTEEDHEKPQ